MKRATLTNPAGFWICIVTLVTLTCLPAPGQSIRLANTATSTSPRFNFRFPQAGAYRFEQEAALSSLAPAAAQRAQWLRAWPENGSTNFVEFGSRIELQLDPTRNLQSLIAGHPLELSRVVASNLFVLQAPDALTAANEAHRLAALDGVLACHPVLRRQSTLHGPYAARPNDPFCVPYFYGGLARIDAQWWLEDRDWDTTRLGIDLDVLAAWAFASGQGITVAVADSGVELTHSELTNRVFGAPHFNFASQDTNASAYADSQSNPEVWTHATSVAGIIAAEGNNGRGICGVAPLASIASWVIYDTNGSLVSDEVVMDMFEYASNVVAIQNHSWGSGNGLTGQAGPTLLEQAGIANAVTLGRNGLGTVMVRSAGNDRSILASANDDGYPNDPQVIAVAAVEKTGRATDYSEPGACILVGAPGGDPYPGQGLVALDLTGSFRGVNSGVFYFGDFADYRWGVQGFAGTSAAAPMVSGVAALVLSVNTNLSYRDVQQILLLSARHGDLTDPDIVTNGAGLVVSHNVGFGIPDAGEAVRLARSWPSRPPLTSMSITDSRSIPIPDAGLVVEVTGVGIPPALASIPGRPSTGRHADQPTPFLPLLDIGEATNLPPINLTNKGALILRGDNTFDAKIAVAAQAGAAFAIIYNSAGDDNLVTMAGTDYAPIPAIFIGNSAGEALTALFQTNSSAAARIRLISAERVFHVSSQMLCEHIGVRLQTDHPVRGDLRVTLLSPQGTRSVLQRENSDTSPGPTDWTYWSTHHFYESSVGDWKIEVTDEVPGNTGSVLSAGLIIRGTQIMDADHDGLDDLWEFAHFGSLTYGAMDDPDGDGYNNAREQVMGTDPLAPDRPFQLDLSPWQLPGGTQFMRLSWPGVSTGSYEIWAGQTLMSLNVVTNLPGKWPETEWFTPFSHTTAQFFRVRAKP
jgi:subtilisin-like proprotein convertase family protein/subtilisin family serine protease